MKGKIVNVSRVIALSLVFSAAIGYSFAAWTPPTVAPPGGNPEPPINTSVTAQIKTGNLGVNILNAANSITTPSLCLTGVCKSAWPMPAAGDNLGNHSATQALEMNGNRIRGGGAMTITGIGAINPGLNCGSDPACDAWMAIGPITGLPSAKLDILNGSGGYALNVRSRSSFGGTSPIGSASLNIKGQGAAIIEGYDTGSSLVFKVNATGVITTASLAVAQNCVSHDAAGKLINCLSDSRLKKNIASISDSMDVIAALKQLRGVYFNWDTSVPAAKDMGEGKNIGLIAQEVEKVFPEVVGTDTEGYKTLDKSALVGFLIEVNKKQQAEIEELQKDVEYLKTKVR